LGFKFRNLENEISIWVRKWELKTCVLKPKFESPNSRLLSQRAIINSEKVQSLGLTAEPCRKPKTNNQQLLRNKSKLKYEENLRFEIPDPKMKDPKNNKLNSRFTLIGPLLTFSFLVIFWGTSKEYIERRHGEPFKFLFLPKMGLLGSQAVLEKKVQF
jgi:hypothetical protein